MRAVASPAVSSLWFGRAVARAAGTGARVLLLYVFAILCGFVVERSAHATPEPSVPTEERGAPAPVATSAPRGEITLRPFLRFDEFKWSIAGGNIDVISELDWNGLRTAGLEVRGRLALGRVSPPGGWLPPMPVSLFGDLSYGHTYRGSLRDSDYALSGKMAEFSRSRSHTDRGRVIDLLVGVQLELPRIGRVRAAPILGVSYHEQRFGIRDGISQIPATGTIAGLDSEYRAERYGFLFGGEVAIALGEDLELYSRCIAERAEYRAEADFNLRGDLGDPSFEQTTTGQGVSLRTGLTRALGEQWQVELAMEHRYWDADSGQMKFNLAGGGASRQRLNDVELRSFTLSAGVVYRF
jgi:hypothetical protein